MNLEALISAIGEKEACTHRKHHAIKKLAQDRELLTKLNQGKFSIKTVLKNKDQKAQKQMNLISDIEQREKDIDNWDKLKKIMTIYLAEIAIPKFRRDKRNMYIFTMQDFLKGDFINAQAQISCWGEIL